MFLLITFTAFLAFLIIRQLRSSKNYPPGPVPLPLIGNVHQLVYYSWREGGVVAGFNHFRKTYGDIFTIWLGPLPHVSITDYDTCHEVFVKNGNKYKDRFLPPIFACLSENHGFVAANGEMWAETRKFALLTFRTMGVGKSIMEEKIMAELDARCEELGGRSIIEPAEIFDLTVGSVINSILVGERFVENNMEEFLEIKRLMDESAELFSIFDMTVPIWFLKKFFPQRFELAMKMQMNILDYVSRGAVRKYKAMKAGELTIDSENPQDFSEAFLAKMQQNEGNPVYSMKALKHMIGDLWIAGQDTTTTTLVSGINQLVNNPRIFSKMRQELRKVTGGTRSLSLQDKTETPYLNAVIAETQRHASVLNVNFWRINHEETTIKGYPVAAGALVTAQIGAVQVSDDVFKNPNEFRPERFIEDESLHQKVMAFGIGKRSCVGENLAKAQLYLILGNLILRYKILPYGALPKTEDLLPYSSGKMADKKGKLEFVRL